jgi:hypothetical protein
MVCCRPLPETLPERKGVRKPLELFCEAYGVVLWLYTSLKVDPIIYFKWIILLVCKLYLNKVDLKCMTNTKHAQTYTHTCMHTHTYIHTG